MSLNTLHLEGTITFYRSIQWRIIFFRVRKISYECLVNPTCSTIYISSRVFKLPHKSIALWILIQTTKKLQVFMGLERLVSYLERTDVALILGQYNPALDEVLNPSNPELNPICYLLALLGAHHFLHVSRIRVKLLTFRLLMSYIYGAPILDVSRSHTTTQHSR